jgi:myo-inositol-1(or 4)-monophosphatase
LLYRRGLKPWDIAAGKLIVEEADGIVSRLDGDEINIFEAGTLLAAGPGLYEEILSELKLGSS